MDYFELSNGAKIPCLGTGPSAVYRRMNDINYKWKWISDIPLIGRLLYRIIYIFKRQKVSRQWVDVLSESLKVGNRLIDYSNSYGDGNLLGQAIIKSGIDRKELFIISRASNSSQFIHSVREEFLKSLSNMELEYVYTCFIGLFQAIS